MEDKKQKIKNVISDIVSKFVYYDRKEDEDLSMNDLDEAVKNGVITVDEMVAEFRTHLEEVYKY